MLRCGLRAARDDGRSPTPPPGEGSTGEAEGEAQSRPPADPIVSRPDGSFGIRLRSQAEVADLCRFFAGVGGWAGADPADPTVVVLRLPGALSPQRERIEVAAYVRTWQELGSANEDDAIRASDAEREQAVAQLRRALVEGRLSLEEFSDRVGHAHSARTQGALAATVRELPAAGPATPTEPSSHRALCSRLERRGAWRVPQRSSYRAIFGTIDLDLRHAVLDGPGVELEIFNLFSTVTVLVPEGVLVTVTGGGAFASQVIDHPATAAVAGAPEIRLALSGPGGTTYVRYAEPVSVWRRLLDPASNI